MKKYLIALVILILVGSVSAEEPGRVKIIGDRVSLRAAPGINTVLMDRAMNGDFLQLQDNSNPDWIGVMPPENMDVWVAREYIRDDTVMPARLNIRSGPSLNHGVVGEVQRGDVLTVRGEAGGWLRIAPPKTVVVWVSRNYAEVIGAPKKTVIRVNPSPESVAAERVGAIVIVNGSSKTTPALVIDDQVPGSVQFVETVDQPEINEVMVAASRTLKMPVTLVPNPDKAQGVEKSYSGILRSAEGVLSRLVGRTVDPSTVCYVRGNAAQMKAYADLPLAITGKTYWALGLKLPVIVPVKIQILGQP